jgi:outer membrane lipoprotein LolB
LWLAFTVFFASGCAFNPSGHHKNSSEKFWQGRLLMQVDATVGDQGSRAQSMTASFELQGDADSGSLHLFTPLGTTLAQIQWTPQQAQLQASGETRRFDNLEDLTQALLGAPVPRLALFAWLQGQDIATEGWQVDLSGFAQGQIRARRLAPEPQARLRLILEP